MKKVLIGILTGVLLVSSPVSAKEEIEQLYAQSAVLMDADNGRVLFEKNGSEKADGEHDKDHDMYSGIGGRKSYRCCECVRKCGETAESTSGDADG